MGKSGDLQELLNGIEANVEKHKKSGFGIPNSFFKKMILNHRLRSDKVKRDITKMREDAQNYSDELNK